MLANKKLLEKEYDSDIALFRWGEHDELPFHLVSAIVSCNSKGVACAFISLINKNVFNYVWRQSKGLAKRDTRIQSTAREVARLHL